MPEKFEIGFYEFIRSELGNLEMRIGKQFTEVDRRFTEIDRRFTEIDRRFIEMEARTDKRFDKLEEEVRWPRRVATGGVITTVIAIIVAIIGFKR